MPVCVQSYIITTLLQCSSATSAGPPHIRPDIRYVKVVNTYYI